MDTCAQDSFNQEDISDPRMPGVSNVSHADIIGQPWGGSAKLGVGDPDDPTDSGRTYYEGHWSA